MSTTHTPYGLVPAYHPSGLVRTVARTISSGYATNIFQFAPITVSSDGTVICPSEAVAGTSIGQMGAFAGVSYTGANGRPVYSNYWPASTVASDIVCYTYEDPDIVYRIMADNSLSQTNVGNQFNIGWTTSGNTSTGLSYATLSQATLSNAGSTYSVRVIGLYPAVDNAWADAFTQVFVQMADHKFVATRVAF